MEVESPKGDTYKLIGIQKLSAQGSVGVKLKLQARSEVYQVKRIRMSAGKRISIETSYIPTSYLDVYKRQSQSCRKSVTRGSSSILNFWYLGEWESSKPHCLSGIYLQIKLINQQFCW